MNTIRNEEEVTAEDTRRKMRNAAETINDTWIRQRRFNDRRRQSKIEDSYIEQNEFKSVLQREDNRRHPKKDKHRSKYNKCFFQ